MLVNRLQESLRDAEYLLETKRALFNDNKEEISRVMKELEFLGEKMADVRLNQSDIDLVVVGGKSALNEVWGTLRSLGYTPTSRPSDESATFSGWFTPEGDNNVRFWLSFTSTSCKRVKVGTKMVEQDIYEVQCEEQEHETV